MMKLAADLHIHSCLSPCADMGMTPNNIANMAYIKGLQAIAVCDHNTARNLPACKAAADACGLLFIPGMEVESKEEVHVLTLFPAVPIAMEFSDFIYEHLPRILNRPDFFGQQVVMDENDQPIGTEERMLIQSTMLSIDEIVASCRARGGVPIPAHINRTSNSLLYNLGFIPPQLHFTSLEVCRGLPVQGPDLSSYHILYNSDAHNLGNISEAEYYVSAYEKTAEGILRCLAQPK